MSPTSVEQLLTVEDVLKLLHLSRSKLHQMVRDGELPAVKFGRSTRFRAAAVQALILGHEVKAGPPSAKVRGL